MKIIAVILLSVFALCRASAGASVSIEEFKKMDIPSQLKEIKNVPPERKAEFESIMNHAILVLQYGGEEGLKAAKEGSIASGRAHWGITRLFDVECKLWYAYVAQVGIAIEKTPGVTQKEIDKTEAGAWKKYDEARARRALAVSLIFHTASTPKALVLTENSAKMAAPYVAIRPIMQGDVKEGYGEEPLRPFSKEELVDLDRKADELLAEIKKLPMLPQAQLQKEYDAFREESFTHWK